MEEIRQQLVELARRMFERRLSDTAGGNISVRWGKQILISPRYSASKQHWHLQAEDFIAGDIDNDTILSHPRFSREGKAHLAIYRHFPDVNGIIHAHPFHVLPFCAAGKPIEPMLEQTQKFGVVPVCDWAPAHSEDLAANVVACLQRREEAIRKQAAAVVIPKHGLIVAGKDILAAFDALERIDWNAWCIMAQPLLASGQGLLG